MTVLNLFNQSAAEVHERRAMLHVEGHSTTIIQKESTWEAAAAVAASGRTPTFLVPPCGVLLECRIQGDEVQRPSFQGLHRRKDDLHLQAFRPFHDHCAFCESALLLLACLLLLNFPESLLELPRCALCAWEYYDKKVDKTRPDLGCK